MIKHDVLAYFAVAALVLALTLSGCEAAPQEPPAHFDAFRSVMQEREPFAREETGEGGYIYRLESGALAIALESGAEIWCSEESWWVEDFRLGDVDGDGVQDVLFSLWKSHRFGEARPARFDNNDDTVRNHLFLYTVLPGHVKAVWCSSDLPRPIYSFELAPGGEVTPVSSGMLLYTEEGAYRNDHSRTEPTACKYAWEGWGFVPRDLKVASATISVVGDLMVHEAQMYDALSKGGGEYNFDYCFADVSKYLRAGDYTIGNLETTFPGDPAMYSDFPFFGAPEEFGKALKNSGFDMVTTANNHCLDKGESGLLSTLNTLDALGLEHIGTYKSVQERDAVFLKNINGINFAFISYAYGTNGRALPEDKDFLVNVMSAEDSNARLLADIKKAKALNPDFIAVLPHMGDEYANEPKQEYVDSVSAMLMAGADIVLCTHPHVVQRMEFVDVTDEDGAQRRCFVAYSLGNFISSQREHNADNGVILNIEVEKVEGKRAAIKAVTEIPTWVQFNGSLGGYDIKIVSVDPKDDER